MMMIIMIFRINKPPFKSAKASLINKNKLALPFLLPSNATKNQKYRVQ